MYNRIIIVFLLGFSSGLPLSLLGSTLQAWFATSSISIMTTGLLSLLGIPYAYKFLWSPLLDRFSLGRLGKRKSWLLLTQSLLLIGFLILSFIKPTTHPHWMIMLSLMLAFVSATQDLVIDAQRIEYLPKAFHGLGASVAVLGYRIALLVSGGLALVLASDVGFSATYQLMAALMMVGLVATLMSKEPQHPTAMPDSLKTSYTLPLKDLLSRHELLWLLGFIFFYKLGEAFTATTSGIVMPFLILGIGFEIDTIGYVNKILGVSSIIAGGIIAGLFLIRYRLYHCLMIFGIIQAATNLLFILLAFVGKNFMLLCIAVVSDNFATGMGSTALVALMMRSVDVRYTATQMSILAAFATLPRIASGPIGAMLQQLSGWVGLYQVGFVLSLCYIPFLIKLKPSFND